MAHKFVWLIESLLISMFLPSPFLFPLVFCHILLSLGCPDCTSTGSLHMLFCPCALINQKSHLEAGEDLSPGLVPIRPGLMHAALTARRAHTSKCCAPTLGGGGRTDGEGWQLEPITRLHLVGQTKLTSQQSSTEKAKSCFQSLVYLI